MLVQYTIRSTSCGNCGKILKRGFRRFGPAQVECGYCDTVINTGLEGWTEMTLLKKIIAAFTELIYPSSLRGSDMSWLILFFHVPMAVMPLFLLLNILFMLALYPFSTDPQTGNALITMLPALTMIIYPILFIIWIWFMIKESIRFAESGVPPVWKAGGMNI